MTRVFNECITNHHCRLEDLLGQHIFPLVDISQLGDVHMHFSLSLSLSLSLSQSPLPLSLLSLATRLLSSLPSLSLSPFPLLSPSFLSSLLPYSLPSLPILLPPISLFFSFQALQKQLGAHLSCENAITKAGKILLKQKMGRTELC